MNSKSKIDTVFSEAATELRRLQSIEDPLGRWCQICTIFSETIKKACNAGIEDIRVLPFYWIGLDCLRHAPKGKSPEEAVESLDDSSDFYSVDEQISMMGYLSMVMRALEEWAEVQDLRHGNRWRYRADARPWRKENLEECDEADRPPYYGWVLVTINRIRLHFKPPTNPIVEELECDPYFEQLFAFQHTRQQWRFCPLVVEELLSQVPEPEPESPLVGKYLAWGAPSVEDIPSCYLKVKDDRVARELHERVLKIRAKDRSDLFSQLAGAVSQYVDQKVKNLQDLVDEMPNGELYQGRFPLCVVEERLAEIEHGIADHCLRADGVDWAPLIAAALKLPRYRIHYFDWAACHEDEGPSEPGLMYLLENGTRQEVHSETWPTKWHDRMDNVEYKIGQLIETCKELARGAGLEVFFNEWLDIETNWNACRDAEMPFHSLGDVTPFAESFCRGILKLVGVLPQITAEVATAEVSEDQDPEKSDEGVKESLVKLEQGQEEISHKLDTLGNGLSGQHDDRSKVIALVREILSAKLPGVCSIPKAIHYIRFGITNSDQKYYGRAMVARQIAMLHGKTHKGGEDAFWRSVRTQAKPSYERQVVKRKKKGKPGLIPVPQGWDS